MCRVAGIQTGLGPSSNSLRISAGKGTPGASTTTTTTTTTTTPKKAPAPSIVPGLTRELDELFLRAAQVSTRAVDVQKLEDTVQHAPIDEDTRTDVIAAARRAKDALANLSRFTGQEIASAYNTITDEARRKLEAAKRNAAAAREGAGAAGEETDVAIEGADAVKDEAALAFDEALKAQADLSDKLRDVIKGDVPEELSDALTDMLLQCDRRQSEILTLAAQLAAAVEKLDKDTAQPAAAAEKHDEDPAQPADTVEKNDEDPAQLDATVEELLPRQALNMHGNASALEQIQKRMKPLDDAVTAFADKPNASLKSRELSKYAAKLDSFADALELVATKGSAVGDGHVMPDKGFLAAAAELARSARRTIAEARTDVGMRSLKAFVLKAFTLPPGYPSLSPSGNLKTDSDSLQAEIDYVESLAPNYGHLVRAARCRLMIAKLAQEYADNPNDTTLSEMKQQAMELSSIARTSLRDDINAYHSATYHPGDYQKLTDELAATKSMLAQITHLEVMARNVQTGISPEQFLTTTSARALLEGELQFSTLVEARINGMSDADVNPALDDSLVVSSIELAEGMANTVYLVRYLDKSEYVFKPEGPGRSGLDRILLTEDYEPQQQVAQLNLAAQRTADALGLGDVMAKTSVGCHNGDYGIFMEKAPGITAEQLAKDMKPKNAGTLSAQEICDLPPEDFRIVVGRLLRALNRLEWFDLVTGQGDRHNANYFIEVKPDLSVTVKGIDNDACFPAYRPGLRTFVLTDSQKAQFEETCEEIRRLYPGGTGARVVARIKADPSRVITPEGTHVIDAGKIVAGEMYAALKGTIGVQTVALPSFIDADLYKHLLALKSGSARKRFQSELTSRLPANAVTAAMKRLDEAIALAETLTKDKVVKGPSFESHDVQKQIVAGRITDPTSLVKPAAGEEQSRQGSSVYRSTNLVQSLFFRDIFPYLDHPDWFD